MQHAKKVILFALLICAAVALVLCSTANSTSIRKKCINELSRLLSDDVVCSITVIAQSDREESTSHAIGLRDKNILVASLIDVLNNNCDRVYENVAASLQLSHELQFAQGESVSWLWLAFEPTGELHMEYQSPMLGQGTIEVNPEGGMRIQDILNSTIRATDAVQAVQD